MNVFWNNSSLAMLLICSFWLWGGTKKEITFSNDSPEDVCMLQIKAIFFIMHLSSLNSVLAPVQNRVKKMNFL